MPKGVEHTNGAGGATNLTGVFLPLMPKGVEHTISVSLTTVKLAVFLPLMPKGVEHIDGRQVCTGVIPCSFR